MMDYGEEQIIHDFEAASRVITKHRSIKAGEEEHRLLGDNGFTLPTISSQTNFAEFRIEQDFIIVGDAKRQQLLTESMSILHNEHYVPIADKFCDYNDMRISAPSNVRYKVHEMDPDVTKAFILAVDAIIPEDVNEKLATRLSESLRNTQLRKRQIASFTND